MFRLRVVMPSAGATEYRGTHLLWYGSERSAAPYWTLDVDKERTLLEGMPAQVSVGNVVQAWPA